MRAIVVPLGLGLGVLVACGQPAGNAGAPARTSEDGTALRDHLEIEIDRGDGAPAEPYRLICTDRPEGTLSDPVAACEHLRGMENPLAPLGDGLTCTQQYGGPQTARIEGTWNGDPVDLELSRTNGCYISQWDGLGPVLPGPVGVAPQTDD